MKTSKQILRYSLAASLTLLANSSQAQDAKGCDRTVSAEHLEPAIPRQAQDQAALAATARTPTAFREPCCGMPN